ncbi:sacsin N-terminal ATP-binding-like domain-containing protein [Pseudonocardia sp. H11422]|uniref:sacsin N-terminal ATP-binding-like domain-containing protein n=1 Tax=Pseudonocardia sp. H11422 TaxID=2835866 RepID=UPI001BDC7230|nr:ATP-binding protein [Pseudonocardia sp. H11422]
MAAPEITDPYRTAALRAAVLDAWASSPTRFREDANAEEDLLLGGYAEAWFVELAQNAADAARAAGVPGRLRVALADGELRVANTGVPLDAAGVTALASLRASAKRDDGSVGRFGVGFAAVLPLSGEPRVVSGAGLGVRFSGAGTAAAVAALPGPAAELARRGGQLPILRLAWPVEPDEPAPPAGFDTEVRLPLRDGVGGPALLVAALDAAPDLLLALPDLTEITVGNTVLRRVCEGRGAVRIEGGEEPRHWSIARRAGRLDTADAGAQATEQRGRRDWTVCWAVPVDATGRTRPLDPGAGDVLHAPTASAERMSLPARLVATVPLEPDRRRTRGGPVTDRILAEAGPAYLDLVRAVPPGERLGLVPVPGFPRSEIDGRIRAVLLDALRGAAWLPAAADPAGLELTPRRAEWLDLPGAEGLAELLAGADGAFAGLIAPDAVAGAPAGVLAELGVHRLGADELVGRLLGVRRPGAWWQAVYAALTPAAETVPGLIEQLRGLPVPLADGRTVAGPSSVLLPGGDPSAGPVARLAELGLPGLHIADPGAVHPLLSRLGAAPADPAGVLDHPALRDAVERSVDDAEAGLDTGPLADAVLGLIGEVGSVVAARHPWLGALALRDDDGEPGRADELMLPDAALRSLLAQDVPVGVLDAAWAQRIPRSVLTAVGVLDGFAVLVDEEPAGPGHHLHDEDRWWEGLTEPPARLLAVRDLDLVADDAWPAALRLLAGEPDTRAAVLHGGYTAWWLSVHARLDGRRPGYWRLASASGLAELYDPAPGPVPDEAFLAAIGVRTGLAVADARDAADLLARLSDPARRPDVALVAAAHAELAAAVAAGRVDPAELDPPQRVRALDGTVVDVDDAVVLDAPWLAAVLPAAELVGGGGPGDLPALADLLDLPLASDVVSAAVPDPGRPVRWAELAEVVVACHTLGVPVPPGEVLLHDELVIDVRRPVAGRRTVPAWPDADGWWHAADPLRALMGLLATDASDEPVAG